ncbi:mammalian cell entry protein [Mycobacterium sp. CBMA 234]|uniref:MlaD family protein n=1 Tax=Mycolicibacterium sp. CBMA 234 TaxID=1918495 RepID=UPI00139082C9|nr:MlaD family protein [Mycolicibacterium sp. CBMA 234]MUL64545.1 mammalian cell entry protein [Mycolicibacterium sp. CBMA 234]
MRLRDVVSFLAFAAIIVFVLGYLGSLGLRVAPPSHRTNLSMDIPDVNGLVVDSNVLLRGAPVGKVTRLRTSLQASTIDFYIDGEYRIPEESDVRLENLSALGESFIEFVPRSDGGRMFQDGQRVSTKSITQQPSVSELTTSVVRVLNQLDPDAVKRIIGEADAALPDPSAVLPNLSHASIQLNNMANGMNGQGFQLLTNFQTLLRNAEWVNPALVSMVPQIQRLGVGLQDLFKLFSVFYQHDNPNSIMNLNNLVVRIQGLLDDRGGDLKVLGEAFQPKLNAIAAVLMNFDSGQILDNFLNQVPADGTITLRVAP